MVAQTDITNMAVFCDFENVALGVADAKYAKFDIGKVLERLLLKGSIVVKKAYCDWDRYKGFKPAMHEASFEMIEIPHVRMSGKNSADIRMVVDALDLCYTKSHVDTFVIVSGDSDFSPLVSKLRENAKYVIGVGIRESTSDLLVQNCDEYYSYNALAGLVKSGEAESTSRKWDPWELVKEAIARMQSNHDVMRSDRLKQVMQDIDASFDEKDLGMSKFSRFCQEAAHRGLIQVTKLENGQLEVAPPSGDAPARSAAASSSEPAAETNGEDAPREGRSRRGRRGGRGRKRGGAAEAGAEASVAATEPSAEAVVEFRVGRAFPNCPRYIHNLATGEISKYAPRDGHVPEEPEWKTWPEWAEVLPKQH